MRSTVTDRLHKVLMRGEGLRPVLRYARISPCTVVRVDLAVNAGQVGNYAVTFYFEDASQSLTYWADWRVLLDWLRSRHSWTSLYRIRFAHPDLFQEVIQDKRLKGKWVQGIEILGPNRWEEPCSENSQTQLTS